LANLEKKRYNQFCNLRLLNMRAIIDR